MSNRTHALAQQLTGKASVEECSLEEVRQICKRHPYFAAAQFLLVQKLKQTESPDLEEQQQKAVLFFPDPLLFDFFISSDKFYGDEVFSENSIASSPDIAHHESNIGGTAQETKDVALNLPAVDTDNNSVSEGDFDALASKDEKPLFVQSEPNELNIDRDENAFDTYSQRPGTFEEGAGGVQNTAFEAFVSNNPEMVSEPETNEAVNSTDFRQPELPKEELAFEPFHTVDYFASQGIKVTQDSLSNDRLGKQLKSFTDWLKTMKRLPASHIVEQVEIVAEKKVEKLASHSVTESTVITEAMAEVWAKQGNMEKAAETYNKLSLLNPSKKAFFAAKIENLKTS